VPSHTCLLCWNKIFYHTMIFNVYLALQVSTLFFCIFVLTDVFSLTSYWKFNFRHPVLSYSEKFSMQVPSIQLLYRSQLHTNWYIIKHYSISTMNDTQRRKSKCSEKNLSRDYSLKHKSHTGWPKIKPGLN